MTLLDRLTIAEAEDKAQLYREIQAAAKVIRREKQDEKKRRRAEREIDLADKLKALPDKKYGVIYADPPWSFKVYSQDTGMDRAAANHYPTQGLDEVFQTPVNKIAADDCILFLWATVPMLPQALEVMKYWGFDYKSHFVWLKDKVGTGYWNRNEHELLLIGTRGHIPCPAMGTQFHSTFSDRQGRHSEKPEKAYEIIESYFPNLPKIELHARVAREGWTSWGLEVPTVASDAHGK